MASHDSGISNNSGSYRRATIAQISDRIRSRELSGNYGTCTIGTRRTAQNKVVVRTRCSRDARARSIERDRRVTHVLAAQPPPPKFPPPPPVQSSTNNDRTWSRPPGSGGTEGGGGTRLLPIVRRRASVSLCNIQDPVINVSAIIKESSRARSLNEEKPRPTTTTEGGAHVPDRTPSMLCEP